MIRLVLQYVDALFEDWNYSNWVVWQQKLCLNMSYSIDILTF